MGQRTYFSGTRMFSRLVWLSAVALTAGCGWIKGGFLDKEGEGTIFVPEFKTPREQWVFAHDMHTRSFMPVEPAQRPRHLKRLVAGYEKVIERFPEDQQFTPLAKLEICELQFRYEQYPLSLQMADSIIADYSSIEYIDAKARFVRGLSLENLDRRIEAQKTYKECIDKYKDSTDELVKVVIGRCRRLYERVVAVDYE